MRGRGFGRAGTGNRSDHFRSRAPNTSRPPSMHVDDFVKLENQHGNAAAVPSSQSRRTEKVSPEFIITKYYSLYR